MKGLINRFRKHPVKSSLYALGCIIIIVNLYLASIHLFLGDVMFHTDIARDFLLMENQVSNAKIELIGPKAGGISGMYFGPLWYWATTPVYLIGQGNPVVVGVFWYFLVVVLLGITYFVAKRIFDSEIAFITLVLMSFYSPSQSLGFTCSFGSLLTSPFIFYFLFLFLKSKKILHLTIAFLLIGITYHLQVAFAMIMIVLTLLMTFYFVFKTKKATYLLSPLALLLPASTFILFEFRHNFLQIRSFFGFLTTGVSAGRESISFLDTLTNRLSGFFESLNIFQTAAWWSTGMFFLINVFILYKLIKGKVKKSKEFYLLFYVYYFLFWLVTFFFKGYVWGYYSWAFLPLIVVVFSSLIKIIDKKIFVIFLVVLCLYSLDNNWNYINKWFNNFYNKDSSSWILNYNVAKKILTEEHNNFGYYIFSPDEFGYPMKYAMNYVQNKEKNNKANLCKKMKITYLIYYPDDANSIADSKYWKDEKIRIQKDPVSVQQIGALKIEKYSLTQEEIAIPTDPNLLCSLIFR